MLTDKQAAAQIAAFDPFQQSDLSVRVWRAIVPTTRQAYTTLDKLHTECVRARDYAAALHVFGLMHASNVK